MLEFVVYEGVELNDVEETESAALKFVYRISDGPFARFMRQIISYDVHSARRQFECTLRFAFTVRYGLSFRAAAADNCHWSITYKQIDRHRKTKNAQHGFLDEQGYPLEWKMGAFYKEALEAATQLPPYHHASGDANRVFVPETTDIQQLLENATDEEIARDFPPLNLDLSDVPPLKDGDTLHIETHVQYSSDV